MQAMRIHRAVGSRRKGLMAPLDFSRSVNPVNQVGRCRLCSPHYYLDLQEFQTFIRLWDISRYCFVLLITIFIREKKLVKYEAHCIHIGTFIKGIHFQYEVNLLTLIGLGLIKINDVSANFNNPRPSLISNN